MRIATLLLLALLAGCASTEKATESWTGASYDDVVRTWGPPSRSARLSDGADVHTWVSATGPVVRQGPAFGVGVFGGSGGGGGMGVGASFPFGGGGVGPPARCERTMTFRNGRLSEQNWIGPADVCASYQRAK
jgi:hypothetical protein